jgi:hypothetical protein
MRRAVPGEERAAVMNTRARCAAACEEHARLHKIERVKRKPALSGLERVDDIIKRLAGSPNFTPGVAEIRECD